MKILKKNFFLYDFLVKILLILRYKKNWKVLFYNTKKDLDHNLHCLSQLNKNTFKYIKKNPDIFKYKFNYAVFKLLSKDYQNTDLKILEIGTFDGSFSKYLSNIFPKAKISTIDLSINDKRFIDSYKRNNEKYLNNFLKIREENLRSSRINFIELDSINLMDVFKEETFDLIWVDGDHSYPTVEKDINNSYLLLKKGGYIVIDDVSKINTKNETSEGSHSASLKALEKLKKNKKINYFLINKFVRPDNFFNKTYIAFFQK